MDTQSQTQSNTTNSKPNKSILLGYIFDFVKQNVMWVVITIFILFITYFSIPK